MGSVYQRPNSSRWWISYNIGGRRHREAGGNTKREAELLLAKREVEIHEGRYFPDKKSSELTMQGLEELWLEHARAKGKKSVREDGIRFPAIVEHFGARTLIATLRPTDVERFIDKLRQTVTRNGTPMAPATINRHLALLRSALRFADANGYRHRDPMRGVKLLAERNRRDRVATEDEIARLIEHAAPELRLAIILLRETAMRMGEVAALEWDRVDLDEGFARLRDEHTKTDEGRDVPLSAAAVEALRAWPKRIVTSDDGTRTVDPRVFQRSAEVLSASFSRLVRQLEIPDLHAHDFRHLRATEYRRAGVDLYEIAAITGHKSLTMLQRYQKIERADLRRAVERVDALRTPTTKKRTSTKKGAGRP